MTKATISLNAKSNTAANLQLNFRFDNIHVKSMILTDEIQQFYYEFNDAPRDHIFEIELLNKKPKHTSVDQNNKIVADIFAEIFDVKISGIELGPVFYGQSVYFYNNPKPVVGQFFRQLGCNGIVRFKFYSPAYAWLMENI